MKSRIYTLGAHVNIHLTLTDAVSVSEYIPAQNIHAGSRLCGKHRISEGTRRAVCSNVAHIAIYVYLCRMCLDDI